jgi:hypothetical protein
MEATDRRTEVPRYERGVPLIMRSLHEVHERNAYRAGRVCLSVRLSARMIQLENHWTDLDEIWCVGCAIG